MTYTSHAARTPSRALVRNRAWGRSKSGSRGEINECTTAEESARCQQKSPCSGKGFFVVLLMWWRGKDSNLRRQSRQIYSLIPLTAREPLHGVLQIENARDKLSREHFRVLGRMRIELFQQCLYGRGVRFSANLNYPQTYPRLLGVTCFYCLERPR